MPKYTYEATDRDGATISGEIIANRVADAIADLTAQGLDVLSVRAIAASVSGASQRDVFYERISNALSKKEELIPAIEAIASELPDPSASRDLRELITCLQSNPSAEQFAMHSKTASWLPVVMRGIASQSTSDRYQQLLADAAMESENRKSIRRTLAYPAFLTLFGGVVLLFLLTTVVPTFDKMFSEFGLYLSPPTQLLVWLSRNAVYRLPQTLVALVLLIAAVVILVQLWVRFSISTRWFGWFTAGSTQNLTAMGRFTGALAELLSFEAPVSDAISIAGRACGHRHFEKIADCLAGDLDQRSLAAAESSVAHAFPPAMIYALDSNLASSAKVSILRELSSIYLARAQARSKWFYSLISPACILILGGLVGFVVIAVFMPLVSLVTSLS